MIRVLHLIDADADAALRHSADELVRAARDEVGGELRTLGRGGDWNGWPRALRALGRLRDQFDLLHAWTPAALRLAALTGAPTVYSQQVAVRRSHIRWLRAVMNYRDVQVVCSTATAQRMVLERGVDAGRCHLIRPGVDFGRIRRRRDPALRRALGFADEDCVLLGVGESTPAANHALALWATGILHELDPRYKLLLWGRGRRTAALARLAGQMRQPGMLRQAQGALGHPVDFADLLPAADIIALTASDAVETLPIAQSMAAGLPIVSAITYTAAELLEDRHTALMLAERTPRVLAQRILELRQDGSTQWSISDMARTEAYEYFALTRFVRQWKGVYQAMRAGNPVRIPAELPGAGIRFHGRG